VEFLNKDLIIEGDTYTMQIWDTAGQEVSGVFRSIAPPHFLLLTSPHPDPRRRR
jgi:GTPase SAR1 family protein